MRCNVCEVDREGEGVGRRGENSAEGPRLFSWKLGTDMASQSSILVSTSWKAL